MNDTLDYTKFLLFMVVITGLAIFSIYMLIKKIINKETSNRLKELEHRISNLEKNK